MARTDHILDASVLLCLLFEEPGHERVEAALGSACIAAANLAEVVGLLVDGGVPPEEAVADLREVDLEVVPMDRAQAEAAGAMRAATRAAGLSLGDRACLALGRLTAIRDEAVRNPAGEIARRAVDAGGRRADPRHRTRPPVTSRDLAPAALVGMFADDGAAELIAERPTFAMAKPLIRSGQPQQPESQEFRDTWSDLEMTGGTAAGELEARRRPSYIRSPGGTS